MKKLVALLLAGVMTLSLAACGNQSSKSEDKKETSKSEEAIQKITDDFMKENPNIKVNLMNQGGYLDLFDKLMASAKAKQLPNLAQIYSNRLSWYVDKGLALDITPYINDPKIGLTDEDKADFPDMFMKDCIWEDWAAAAKALTKDTDGDGEPDVYGIVFADNLSTDIAPWLKQAGGSTMNEETNELYFDTPETKEAVEFLNSMFQAKTARFAGEDKNPNVPLQQGRAAMCVASTSALPYIEADTQEGITINAAALPGHKTDDQLYYGTNVTIFDVGTDAEKEASWLYLKYLTNTKNTAYFAAQTGYIPVRKSAKDDPVFAEVLKEKPMKQLCFDCMDRGFQGTRNIGGINALDALGAQLDLVFSGQKDIDTALKDAQANGEKAMEEARNN